ncbi:MAG: hypothetical protein WBW61_02995 [Rhodanobacteraceae bacterium]
MQSQQPRDASLGAHTLLWQGYDAGTSPAITDPVDTQPSGSSLIVFNAGFTSNTDAPTDNYSNTWMQLGDPVFYRGYDDRFDVKAYVSLVASGGNGHTVSIVKNGQADGEITVPFIEIRNAGVLEDVAQNYPESAPAITSGSVTTTGPATLIAVWWGDAYIYDMTAVPDHGFTVIESLLHLPPNSAVQCAVAYKQVAEAGTYDVTWTQSPEQGAPLWLFAFQSRNGDTIFSSSFE